MLDDGLRTASAQAVVRSATAVAVLLLVGFSLPAGGTLLQACGSLLHATLGSTLLALSVVSVAGLVALVVDAGRAATARPASRIARTPTGSSLR